MVAGQLGNGNLKMDLRLQGKTALITGSTKGIGKAIAKSLYDEGCNIVINSRHTDDLNNIFEDHRRVSSFTADVTDTSSCIKLINHVIEKWGQLDILICNVGNGSSVPPGNETISEWKRMFDINFFSVTNMIEASAKELAKTHGTIVCISSIAGMEILGAPLTYSAAKSSLNFYVKGISKSLAKYGIRINAVAPGNILFHGSVWEKKSTENPQEVQKMLDEDVPLKRFGQPEEVANMVTFLSSPMCAFVTGSIVVIDGGQLRS